MDSISRDVCLEIVKYLQIPDAGALKCTNKFWNDIIDINKIFSIHAIRRQRRLHRLSRHNPLEKLMELSQDLGWNYRELSSNLNVTAKLVLKYPSKPWVFQRIVQNPNFSYDDLKLLRLSATDWKYASMNPNITIHHVLSDDRLDKSWFSCNPNVAIEMVYQYPSFPWKWEHISRKIANNIPEILRNLKENLSWWIITDKTDLSNIFKYPDLPWYQPALACRRDMTVKLIDELPEKLQEEVRRQFWKFSKNIPIRESRDIPWQYYEDYDIDPMSLLGRVTDITINDVIYYKQHDLPHKFWENAVNSPLISIEEILNNKQLPWPKDIWNRDSCISAKTTITIDIVLKHMDFPWNWKLLSQNPGIKLQDVLDNQHLPWEMYWVTVNPNVTLDPILRGYCHASDKTSCADLIV